MSPIANKHEWEEGSDAGSDWEKAYSSVPADGKTQKRTEPVTIPTSNSFSVLEQNDEIDQ